MKSSEAVIINKPFLYPTKRPFLMSNEMEELKKHFEKLEHGQDKTHAKIDMIEDSLKTVKESVAGNAPMGMKGLAQRMEDVEEKQKEYDRIYQKVIGMGLVIGFLWTLLVTVLLKFWDKIF